MSYWFTNPVLKGLLPLALSTSVKGLTTPFVIPKVFMGANVLPEGPGIGPTLVDVFGLISREKRALMVSDPVAEKYAAKVARVLNGKGFKTEVWSNVEPEAPLNNVKNCAEFMKEFEPDLIFAVGGGSVIDAAKAAWILYERPDIKDLCMVSPLEILGLRKKALFVAVPTTSGTGAECTNASVLTDTEGGRKIPIANPELMPDFALLMPEFCMSMPPELTAGTGLDVLAHAMDAVLVPTANDFTDPLALRAIEIVFKYLPRAYRDGKDREARLRMHVAASIAGMAFSNAGGCALTHSLGHSIGHIFKLHHGIAVSFFIPYAFQFYAPVTDKYLDICKILAIEEDSKDSNLKGLIEKVRALLKEMNVPLTLQDFGISRGDFEKNLDKLVLFALEDPDTFLTPRPITMEQCERIYWYAYDGRDIDF